MGGEKRAIGKEISRRKLITLLSISQHQHTMYLLLLEACTMGCGGKTRAVIVIQLEKGLYALLKKKK